MSIGRQQTQTALLIQFDLHCPFNGRLMSSVLNDFEVKTRTCFEDNYWQVLSVIYIDDLIALENSRDLATIFSCADAPQDQLPLLSELPNSEPWGMICSLGNV